LLTAFLLIGWGYYLVRRRLILPLTALGQAARQIGDGHLDRPMPPLHDDELGRLGQTMAAMRSQITTAQETLEQRVERRTHELATAFEFSQEIVHQLDLPQLLQSVVTRARDLSNGTAASVCVLQDDGQMLELVASSGAVQNMVGLRQSTAETIGPARHPEWRNRYNRRGLCQLPLFAPLSEQQLSGRATASGHKNTGRSLCSAYPALV
jgi:nitrate/nitrite-specific signal transduction histidine kinase